MSKEQTPEEKTPFVAIKLDKDVAPALLAEYVGALKYYYTGEFLKGAGREREFMKYSTHQDPSYESESGLECTIDPKQDGEEIIKKGTRIIFSAPRNYDHPLNEKLREKLRKFSK